MLTRDEQELEMQPRRETTLSEAVLRASVYLEQTPLAQLGLLVFALAVLGSQSEVLAQGVGGGGAQHPRYFQACNNLLGLMEGPFGALITTGAGVGAIIASAVGGFKMAWSLVVVAVGAFILRAYLTLFFTGC